MIEENNSNHTLEVLKKAIEFNEQGDLDKAASSYQEVIESIEASGSIEHFLLAKAGLIEKQFLLEEITETEANHLLEQIKTGYASLKDINVPKCGECQKKLNGQYRDGYWVWNRPEGRRECILC